VKPNGDTVMRTVADYRQLNDALFHAGLDSGSRFEWVDVPNRLHFYVLDLHRDERGILSYTVGVRSLDGSGPQRRGVALEGPAEPVDVGRGTTVTFTLANTGTAVEVDPGLHPGASDAAFRSDIYRLAITVEGEGWTARLQNALAAVPFGESRPVRVRVVAGRGAPRTATVTLEAVSVSDPGTTTRVTIEVAR
jgi:hypothetical protein